MSRKLSDLHPTVQAMAEEFVRKCEASGLKIVIYQTLRTFAEQNALYAQGRTMPGKRVTNARGGESYHNYGMAFDFAFIGFGGVVTWDGPWEMAGQIGEAIGFEWGGRWKGLVDKPHLQFTGGLSIKDLLVGKRLPDGANHVIITLYKVENGPEIYLIAPDGMYHHILDEGTFKALFGSFNKAKWRLGPRPAANLIGEDIGLSGTRPA